MKFAGIALLVLLYFFQLGGRFLATPDEARYVEIPREMVQAGDYLTPRLNHVKYFEKPPFFYWVQSFTLKIFSFHEFFLRLAPLFFALSGGAVFYFFLRHFSSHKIAQKSLLVLLLTPLYFAFSRLIILDMAVSTFVCIAFMAFYTALHTEKSRRLWLYIFTFITGLGILTKGIVVLALLGPVLLLWLSWCRLWHRLMPLFLPTNLLLFFAVVLPWHIWVGIENPEFFHKYFYVEHFLRYTTSIHCRSKPIWFFIPVVFLGILPWSFFLPRGLKSAAQRATPLDKLMLLWGGWTFAFYTVGNSKLIPYILPMLMPCAYFVGRLFATSSPSRGESISLRFFSFFLLPLALGGAFYGGFLTHRPPQLLAALVLLCLFYVMMTIVMTLVKKEQIFPLLVMLSGLTIVNLIKVSPFIQQTSIQPLAQYIKKHKEENDKIVSFMKYYQDLPVYTQTPDPVTVVEAFGELAFGIPFAGSKKSPHPKDWMISLDTFFAQWHCAQRLWCVGRLSDVTGFFKERGLTPIILLQEKEHVLFTNHPLSCH